MQEDIDNKMIALSITSTKMTTNTLVKAMKLVANHQKNKIARGKQSVKQLAKQNQGMVNIEITDQNIIFVKKNLIISHKQ